MWVPHMRVQGRAGRNVCGSRPPPGLAREGRAWKCGSPEKARGGVGTCGRGGDGWGRVGCQLSPSNWSFGRVERTSRGCGGDPKEDTSGAAQRIIQGRVIVQTEHSKGCCGQGCVVRARGVGGGGAGVVDRATTRGGCSPLPRHSRCPRPHTSPPPGTPLLPAGAAARCPRPHTSPPPGTPLLPAGAAARCPRPHTSPPPGTPLSLPAPPRRPPPCTSSPPLLLAAAGTAAVQGQRRRASSPPPPRGGLAAARSHGRVAELDPRPRVHMLFGASWTN